MQTREATKASLSRRAFPLNDKKLLGQSTGRMFQTVSKKVGITRLFKY